MAPPMRPGQRYGGYGAAFGEPEGKGASQPPQGGPTYGGAGPEEELRQYQQAYWAQLEGAGEPSRMQPPGVAEPAIPAYLQRPASAAHPPTAAPQPGYFPADDWTVREGWGGPSQPRMDERAVEWQEQKPPESWPAQETWPAQEAWTQQENWPLQEPWPVQENWPTQENWPVQENWPQGAYPAEYAGAQDWGYEAMAAYPEASAEGVDEDWVLEPMQAADFAPYEAPREWVREPERVPPAASPKPPPAPRKPVAEKIREAFAQGPAVEEKRIGKGKLVMGVAVTLMLVFCAVQMGRMALLMMQNEQEMQSARSEYYQRTGVELAREEGLVELLPEGQTFAPTITPEGMATPAPSGARGASILPQAGVTAVAPADGPTLSPRTKQKRYEDNPLGTIREEFAPLRKENPDVVGRMTIEGLTDEVVVQRNNTYYLNHNARGTFSDTGAVFVDEGYTLQSPPENLLLRGQSAFEGKLFQPLAQYVTAGPEFVRQHAVIRLGTLYEEADFVVFAVIVAASDPAAAGYFNYAAYPIFQSDVQMENYVAVARQHSIYEIAVDVQASDRLLTLATLGDGTDKECMVLMARKLRPGETAGSFQSALKAIRAK